MAGRASKSGIGYQQEKKMEANYDREEAAGTPQAIVTWVNGVIQGQHDPCPNASFESIAAYFKDGIALCKLINTLLKNTGGSPVSFSKKITSPFVAMGNLENFSKGCESFGLPKTCIIQSGDVYEGSKAKFYNVLNTLHSLGMLANSKNIQPQYTGKMVKLMDNE
ncbi:transgelin-2-like [Liolophura sinensis]|uniref:transgelin-2-like n=1 Tax=Liolophura sinensis TaxID=3198878 RepID=UPI003157FBEB